MNTERLRVLQLVSPASVGGLERVVHALTIGLLQRGHQSQLAATLGNEDTAETFLEPLQRATVPTHVLRVRMHTIFRELRFVRQLCQELRPHVVHTHGYRPDIIDAPMARFLGIPVVSTEHGMSRMGGRTAIWEWMQLRSLRSFDAVAAVSRPIQQALVQHGVREDRIHLIPNAWHPTTQFLDRAAARSALGLPANGICLGWIGRLIEAKGADVALRALDHPLLANVRMDVIGDGPEKRSLEGLAQTPALRSRVRFHGRISDAAHYLRAFDVFVLSSRTEGTPIVLLEAMAAGVPIAATRVGGVPDMLSHDEAFLTGPDDPSSMSLAIAAAVGDPPGARRRALAAASRLKRDFALEPWLERYERLYRSVLVDRPRN